MRFTTLTDFVRKRHFLLLLLFCGFLYTATSIWYVEHGVLPEGDEPHYLILSQTMLKYHSLDVMQDYTHKDYLQFFPIILYPHVATTVRGEILSTHGIGGPLLWLLPFALLGRLGVVLFITLLSILTIANIYLFLKTMGISARYSFVVSLAYTLASPIYLYSHMTFIDMIATCICIYAMRKVVQQKRSVADLLISSLLLGLLVWLHARFLVIEGPLFVLLLWRIYQEHRWQHWQHYLYLCLPIGLLSLVFEIETYYFWRTLNPGSYQLGVGNQPFRVLPFLPTAGILFDQEFGLLLLFPLFLFLFIGIALTLKRKYLPLHLLFLFVSIPYLALILTLGAWFGGWAPPARYVLVLLPLGSWYIAYALEYLDSIGSRIVLMVSVLWGLGYNILSLQRGFSGGHAYNMVLAHIPGYSQWLTYMLPSSFRPHQAGVFAAWFGGYIVIGAGLILSKRLSTKQDEAQDEEAIPVHYEEGWPMLR
jgi:hypothetical protein